MAPASKTNVKTLLSSSWGLTPPPYHPQNILTTRPHCWTTYIPETHYCPQMLPFILHLAEAMFNVAGSNLAAILHQLLALLCQFSSQFLLLHDLIFEILCGLKKIIVIMGHMISHLFHNHNHNHNQLCNWTKMVVQSWAFWTCIPSVPVLILVGIVEVQVGFSGLW